MENLKKLKISIVIARLEKTMRFLHKKQSLKKTYKNLFDDLFEIT